jgi:D-alanyl-D-alanine carboxypeptidase/D-alanyl-D-alanine-endopeptidase (penicillin-binding protein 4)
MVQVHPGAKAGDPARVIVDPGSEYFVIENTTTTVARGRTSVKVITAVVEGRPPRLSLKVSGTVRVDAEIMYLRKRVEHPDLYAGETFRALLQAQGVRLAGKLVKKGIVPETARALASSTSEPLTVLIRDLNKYSNNFMAETLLKTIGAEAGAPPGTWAKGLEAVRSWLAGIGLKDGTFRYDNGSGLYDSNRFTPLQIATVLRQAYRDFRVSPDFVSALSIAGADGTLGNRMLGTAAERYVRAKSGTLRNVSALAGYAGSVGKPPLVFVVLVNDIPEEWEAGRAARSLQDELAQAMVLYLETAR